MINRRVGIGGLIVLMLAVAVWVSVPKHSNNPASQSAVLEDRPKSVESAAQPVRVDSQLSRIPSTEVRIDAAVKRVQGVESDLPRVDRDFAAAAARPYVESYQRQHPAVKVGTFDWTQFQVISAAANDSIAQGYLAVFFPASEGAAAGYACFRVGADADHLEPLVWGITRHLGEAIGNFRQGVAKGDGCLRVP